MPPLEKIATFAIALDKVSRFYVDYHREISLARLDGFDFETAWRVVSDRFPADPTLAKAMWKSVTLHNKKGSSVPSVEEWNRFEAEWRLAMLRVPEILSSSEQYSQLFDQIPQAFREKIKGKEVKKDSLNPLFGVQGILGHSPNQIICFLRDLPGMPAIWLDESFARDGQVVVSVDKENASLFHRLSSSLRFPGGEQTRVTRRSHETSVDEIFSIVREDLELKELCRRGTLKNERQAENTVAFLQGASQQHPYAEDIADLGLAPPGIRYRGTFGIHCPSQQHPLSPEWFSDPT
jgi:hypothetical protein